MTILGFKLLEGKCHAQYSFALTNNATVLLNRYCCFGPFMYAVEVLEFKELSIVHYSGAGQKLIS